MSEVSLSDSSPGVKGVAGKELLGISSQSGEHVRQGLCSRFEGPVPSAWETYQPALTVTIEVNSIWFLSFPPSVTQSLQYLQVYSEIPGLPFQSTIKERI